MMVLVVNGRPPYYADRVGVGPAVPGIRHGPDPGPHHRLEPRRRFIEPPSTSRRVGPYEG